MTIAKYHSFDVKLHKLWYQLVEGSQYLAEEEEIQ